MGREATIAAVISGLEAGERFGDFEIHGVAGEGGMGIVYRATQISLGRLVALKVISPEIANQPDFQARFEHESRLAASIDHPHVVSIYAAGEHEGQAYIAMQWVDGRSLHDALRGGGLDPDRAVIIVAQIAGALDAAHATGLLHRDVKPANIILRSLAGGDHAYLTDFGVAKRTDVGVTGLTRTGHIVGTLTYMAPEQIRGDPGDGRSDLYSLGCVLFESLAGRQPFERSHEAAVMFAHVNDPRPVVSELRPELGTRFDAVVQRAMAIEPADRYPTGSELAAAANVARLGPAAPTAPGPAPTAPGETRPAATAPPATPPPAPPPRRDEVAEADTARIPPPKRRRGPFAALAALAIVAGIGVGAYAATGGFSSGATTTTVPPATDGGGGGGGGTGGGGGANAVRDRSDIADVLTSYSTAYSNRDAGALGSLLAPNVTRSGVAASGGCGTQRGAADVLAAYEAQFAQGTGTYTLTDLSADAIQVSGNVARTPRLHYTISPSASGTVSFELAKIGRRWLISRIDASC